jgi:hypothetical protein
MKRFLACLAVLALCGPLPVLAGASDPVILNSCGLSYDSTNVASQITGLEAQFTNNGPRTAQVVNIKADIAGNTQVIRDVGTFSPGIEIKHKYRTNTGQFALPTVLGTILSGRPNVTCSIDSVAWDDGTKWIPIAAGAALSSNPSAISLLPNSMFLQGSGTANARLFSATGGGSLSLTSDCGKYANVQILANTSHDLAVRVTPKVPGSCTLTVRDANDNFATVPVNVSP